MFSKQSAFAAILFFTGCALDEQTPASSSPTESSVEQGLTFPTCVPRTCGFEGTVQGCGMQDDGCGGIQWCGGCSCGSTFTACEVDLPVIAELKLTLSPGQSGWITTSNLSSGADSVLHVLSTSGAEMSMNDDISTSNHASSLYIQTSPWNSLTVYVVARAKSASSTGTALLTYPGGSTQVTLSFPERIVSSSRAGDLLQTAQLPALETASQVVYTMNGANIAARTSGVTGTSVAIPSSGTTHYLIGRAALGTTASSVPARLLRNDAGISGHDPDGDGLGTNLESALGTCSSLSGTAYDRFGVGFACSLAADPRDTDGDGLRDDWEVRGRWDVTPNLPLQRWGANPRHKDIFVEADFGQKTTGEPEEAITHDEVATWADFWSDRHGTLTSSQRAAHAAAIQNPDGTIGVHLHVDTGVAPPSATWAALYGDWGGHDIVPPIDNNGDGVADGAMNYATARGQYMASNRLGTFRYALRQSSGGGQGGGLAFTYGGGSRTAAHELGHTATLMHDGRYNSLASINCKPNYPSLMNYGFDTTGVGFADGTGAPILDNSALVEQNGADPATQGAFLDVLASVYKLTVDKTTGDIDWNQDGIIAPAGQTVEAYANYVPQLSCEMTRFRNTDVAGPNQSDLGPALVRLGSRVVIFTAAAANVGWTSTTSTLSCRPATGTACATFTANGVLAGLPSSHGVDAVRLPSSELLVVATDSYNTTRWARVTFSGSTPTVSAIRTLTGPGPIDQPTLAMNESVMPELFYRDATGALFSRVYNQLSDTWSAAQPLLDAASTPVAMATTGSPGATLARALDLSSTYPRMTLAFGGPGGAHGCMQMWYRANTGVWTNETRMPSCDWRITPMGRPAIAWVPDPKDQTLGGRIHIVHTPNYADINKSSLRQLTSVSGASYGPVMGREGLYDNDWAYGYGVDLMYEAGVDNNLRAAYTHAEKVDNVNEDWEKRVRFDPVADGIFDLAYGGENDWETMRNGICKNLVGEQPSPITCPPLP